MTGTYLLTRTIVRLFTWALLCFIVAGFVSLLFAAVNG